MENQTIKSELLVDQIISFLEILEIRRYAFSKLYEKTKKDYWVGKRNEVEDTIATLNWILQTLN
jgi:hypothetical protein